MVHIYIQTGKHQYKDIRKENLITVIISIISISHTKIYSKHIEIFLILYITRDFTYFHHLISIINSNC